MKACGASIRCSRKHFQGAKIYGAPHRTASHPTASSRPIPPPARPHVCMEAIGAHVYADTCLLSQCAGDAPPIDTATTAVIAAAVAAVAVAAPPLLPPSPLPPRRSHVHGAAAPMRSVVCGGAKSSDSCVGCRCHVDFFQFLIVDILRSTILMYSQLVPHT